MYTMKFFTMISVLAATSSISAAHGNLRHLQGDECPPLGASPCRAFLRFLEFN